MTTRGLEHARTDLDFLSELKNVFGEENVLTEGETLKNYSSIFLACRCWVVVARLLGEQVSFGCPGSIPGIGVYNASNVMRCIGDDSTKNFLFFQLASAYLNQIQQNDSNELP